MKYLKRFEDLKDLEELDSFVNLLKKESNQYWLINISNFKESLYKLANLYKIDVTEEYIEQFEHNIKMHIINSTKFIYITYHKSDNDFGWNEKEDYLIEKEYTNMGEVEITPEDIKNYNIWIKSNKYNL